MTPLPLLLACLLSAPGAPHPALGDTVVIGLPVPGGWRALDLGEDSTYSVVWQRGDSAALVPLVLDTLRPQPLRVVRDGDTARVGLPELAIRSTLPGSTYSVSFPEPVDPRIPEGFPSEYLDSHRFWARMGPAGSPWALYVSAAAVVAAAAAALLLRRRRPEEAEVVRGIEESAGERAESLLEHPSYAAGDWEEFYSHYDAILRDIMDAAAGMDCRPLTYTQIGAALNARPEGRELWRQAEPLAREVVLQRYAGWGSSRQRAASHVRRLAHLAARWGA